MNQQQYRLLCMDIDGTLLNSAHKLPPANREAVQSAAKNGVTICLMSARPPRAVFPIRMRSAWMDRWCAGWRRTYSLWAKVGWRTAADPRMCRPSHQETQARGIRQAFTATSTALHAEDEWSCRRAE